MLTLTKFQERQSPLLGEALYSFFLLSATLTQLRKASSQFPSHSSKYSRKRMHSSKPPGSTYRKSPSTFMVSWFSLTCQKIELHVYKNIISGIFREGKVQFTPSNHHKNPTFNLQLQNRIIEDIQLSKLGKFSPYDGSKMVFHFFN